MQDNNSSVTIQIRHYFTNKNKNTLVYFWCPSSQIKVYSLKIPPVGAGPIPPNTWCDTPNAVSLLGSTCIAAATCPHLVSVFHHFTLPNTPSSTMLSSSFLNLARSAASDDNDHFNWCNGWAGSGSHTGWIQGKSWISAWPPQICHVSRKEAHWDGWNPRCTGK